MNRRKFVASLVMVPLATTPLLARGWIVYDPTNFFENMRAAMESIKATVDRAIQIKVQYQQYATQLKQLKSLDPASLKRMVLGNAKQIAELEKYISAAERMHGSVQHIRKIMQGRFDEAKLAKLPFDEYMNVVKEKIKAGVKEAIERAESDRKALERVNEDYEEVLEWQVKIGKTEGLHEAQQLMNSQMSRLVTQNSEVIKLMAAARLNKAREDLERKREEEIARQHMIKEDTDANKALERSREEIERWNKAKM